MPNKTKAGSSQNAKRVRGESVLNNLLGRELGDVMKVKLKQEQPHPSLNETIQWKESLPFTVNPRGVLIHRVRSIRSHFRNGKHSHDSATYWCGNGACRIELFGDPPKERLLCTACEIKAVEAGEKTASELAGRHVCTGKMKAVRLCCNHDEN